MNDLDLANFWSWDHWFKTDPGPAADWYVYLGALLGLILLGVTAWYFGYARMRLRPHVYKFKLARRMTEATAWVTVIGILLIACRLAGLPYLSMRVWLYLDLLVGLGLLIYLGYIMLFRYRKAVAEVDAYRLKAQYYPRPRRARSR